MAQKRSKNWIVKDYITTRRLKIDQISKSRVVLICSRPQLSNENPALERKEQEQLSNL